MPYQRTSRCLSFKAQGSRGDLRQERSRRLLCLWMWSLCAWCCCLRCAVMQAAQTNREDELWKHAQAARQAEKNGDLDQAAAEYRSILELEPYQPEVCSNLGLVYHAQGKYRDA